MECHNENTQMIKHFLQTFNKCLQDYTGIDDYKFDPYRIMCDEGGANMNAIEEVFGKEFMARQRVVTCQWHFKSCVRRQSQILTRMNKKALRILFSNYVNVTQEVNMSRFQVLSMTFVTEMIFYIGGNGGKHESFT